MFRDIHATWKRKREKRGAYQEIIIVPHLCVFHSKELPPTAGLTPLSLSVCPPQDPGLGTLSPASIFRSMFQSPDDAAIQEDPQQTGL